MNKKLLVILFTTFTLNTFAQYEVHLYGSDTVILCGILQYNRGIRKVVCTTFFDLRKQRSEIPVRNVDYYTLNGKYFGISRIGHTRISEEFFKNEAAKRGAIDACRNYTSCMSAANATLMTSFFFGGIAGILPAAITSNISPLDKNLNIPDTPWKNDPTYLNSYHIQAERIKSRKVWQGFGKGVASIVILSAAVVGIEYLATPKNPYRR